MLLNPYVATTGVGSGGGVSYFFEERFEGTGYDNSNANGWVESGTGTVDEDYTGVVLEGTQSLRILGAAQQPNTVVVFDSDQDELWGFFRFRLVTSLSTQRIIFALRDSTSTQVGGVSVETVATQRFDLAAGSGTVAGTADAIVLDTDYNVWWHWIKGTGADGFFSLGFSTTGTEPVSGNAFGSTSVGNNTTDAHELRVGVGTANTTVEYIIDQILISTTGTIGNSPA